MSRPKKASDAERTKKLEKFRPARLTEQQFCDVAASLGMSEKDSRRVQLQAAIEAAMTRYLQRGHDPRAGSLAAAIAPALKKAKALEQQLTNLPYAERWDIRVTSEDILGVEQVEGIQLEVFVRGCVMALERRVAILKQESIGRPSQQQRLSALMRDFAWMHCVYSMPDGPLREDELRQRRENASEDDMRKRDEWIRSAMTDTLNIKCPDPLHHPKKFRELLY